MAAAMVWVPASRRLVYAWLPSIEVWVDAQTREFVGVVRAEGEDVLFEIDPRNVFLDRERAEARARELDPVRGRAIRARIASMGETLLVVHVPAHESIGKSPRSRSLSAR